MIRPGPDVRRAVLAPTVPGRCDRPGTGHGARGTGHGARGTGHGARGTGDAGWVGAAPNRQRPLRFWLLGLAAVAVGAVGIGMAVYLLARPGPADSSEGWAELGAVIGGALPGTLAGTALWLVLLVVYVRRHLSPGGRGRAVGMSLAWVAAGAGGPALVLAVLLRLAGGGGPGSTEAWAWFGAVTGAMVAAAAAPAVVVERMRDGVGLGRRRP